MSLNSFPRQEHIRVLLDCTEKLVRESGANIEAAEAGLDRFRCHYLLKFSHQTTGVTRTVSVHFQLPEKVLATGHCDQLEKMLREAIQRCGVAAPDQEKSGG